MYLIYPPGALDCTQTIIKSKTVHRTVFFSSVHKNDLLVFGNTILQGGLCFVECAE